MDTLIHADIFFFITSIAVGVITFLAIIVLGYIIFILHDFKQITKLVKTQIGFFEEDLNDIRKYIRSYGLGLKTLKKIKEIFSNHSHK